MIKNSHPKVTQTFSASGMKHGSSLFTDKDIGAIENKIIERDGKFYIKCQIKDRYKVAKPEEIIRQFWIYRSLKEFNGQEESITVERKVHSGSRNFGLADIIVLYEDLQRPHNLEVKRGKNDDK
jgi:type I restriction enzyme M protein